MISGTSKNYTGRKVDLSLFPTIQSPSVSVNSGLTAEPKAIAGLSAMAQNYGRVLLTPLGTYRGDPLMGSYFFNKLVTRLVRYPSDIQQTFLIESGRVIDYLDTVYAADAPLDEQVRRATLTDIELQGTSIGLVIELESRAGDSVSFLLPVNWNI